LGRGNTFSILPLPSGKGKHLPHPPPSQREGGGEEGDRE